MSYLLNKKIYISSPIEASKDNEWDRPSLHRNLQLRFGLDVFDPVLDPKQEFKATLHEARRERNFEKMREIARGFVKKDLHTVDKTDILLAVLPYKIPTCGTHHEITHALNIKRPVLIVCEQGKEYIPLWYFGLLKHEFMFSSFSSAYNYLSEVNDGLHKNNRIWSMVYGLL